MFRVPLIHDAAVAEWRRPATRLSAAELVDLFESGLHRMWERAQPTLGEVTLGAIVDRVLYTATERFSFLAPLRIKDGRVDFGDLRKASGSVVPSELANASRFVVREFWTVLGQLTAEILTPALHAELVKARASKRRAPRKRKT
jgi:hypothetical protein